MNNHFTIGKLSLRYCREFFNEAYSNERSVEVALGRWFLGRFDPIIEVGAVLPYYGNDKHEIVDLTDTHPASRKADGLRLDYKGRNVLSISTVEHMNGKEFGNQSDEDCVTFLKKVVAEADNYLITWGVGYNPVLDRFVRESNVPHAILKRTNWKNEYVQIEGAEDAWKMPFGHSDRPIPKGFFNNANGVVVLTNVAQLISAQPPPSNSPFKDHFENTINDRDKVFKAVTKKFGGKPVKILEIGCARDLRPSGKGGDGWSSMFWAEYISRCGGSLTIVDIDETNLSNCKILLRDFAGDKNFISFILGDGYNYIDSSFDFIYLDGSDDPAEMVRQFEKIDRSKTLILCDDFHTKGSALRVTHSDFQSIMANESHEMALYEPVRTQ